MPPASSPVLVFRNLLCNNRRRPNATVHPDRIRRGLAATTNTDIIPRRDLLAMSTLVAELNTIIPIQGCHAFRLSPIALKGRVESVNISALDMIPRRCCVAITARGKNPGKDLAKNRSQSRKARSKDGSADFEEGPVCCLDVLPVRVLGVGGFLESSNPKDGSNASAASTLALDWLRNNCRQLTRDQDRTR